jgi:predicted ATPase
LFHEFKAEASADWTVLEAFSVSHGKGSAYLPVIELLQSYFGVGRDDTPAQRRAKVAAKLNELDPALDAALPFLGALLEFSHETERLAGMDPQLRRSRILEAVVGILLAEAKRNHLQLIVEDLQWLDDESQSVLDLLVERLPAAKLLLLVNFRPEYVLRWGTNPNCRQIRLDALSESNAEEMLSAMLGASPDLLPLKQVIVETTGGTPFFMEETVQSLFDEGAIARENGSVRLVKPLASLRIPPTVQAILAARIDRLHNDEKNLLQTLAVLGRDFVLSLARAVAGKSEEELERLIVNLQLGEFVYEQPSISDVEYTFKHALTQEVAYNSVLMERRKQLHESVGQAMESIYSGSLDDHLADLARHFSRSGNRAKAVEYLRRAGTQAISRGALAQAVTDFETALELLKTLPGGDERDGLELQVLNPLGTAYIAVRGYAAPEVGPVFQRARELCDKIGEPQQQFLVVFGNFAWRIVRGEMDLALGLAQEAFALAEQLDDPGIWMEALFLMGVVLFYRGDFAGARQQYERALANYDDRKRNLAWALRVGEDAGVTHRCYLALTLWHLGFPERALRLSNEATELARAIGHPFSLSYAQHHASWLHQLIGLADETLALGEEQALYAADQGFPLFRATGMGYAASGRLMKGQVERGLPELVAGLEAYRATGAGLALPHYYCLLGGALGQAGRGFDATALLDHALDLVEQSQERCHEAELHRLKGEMALSQGLGQKVAETHIRKAIETAKTQGSKAWEVRARVSLARLLKNQEGEGEAQRNLAEIVRGYGEGLDSPDLEEARAILADL